MSTPSPVVTSPGPRPPSRLPWGSGASSTPPRSVALLTAGYSVGQILGPPAVAPLLRHGHHSALLSAALVVLLAAVTAGVLRIGFPHHIVVSGHTVRDQQRESNGETRSTRAGP
ncbi:hypothetical protein M2163_007854 [Streptomyces sp. SAI-135]|uniref:hypothetical protein n=1 Tax=Streptomyces sp. SAI-124 TaxID=3377730 RepID=UPI00247D5AA6|nr:hypothetical protein [Streptomyces sp. SAI-090]MDH6620746.1 hypothetical protein [Streptomyces sp. SAI-135]